MVKFFGITTASARKASLKVALIYLLLSSLWILLSDKILLHFVEDPRDITYLQTLKGWIFVLASATLIACLTNRNIKMLRRHDERLREIAQGISVATGEAFFNSLTKHLAQALNVDCAVIFELPAPDSVTIRTLSASVGGRTVGSIEFTIAGSPWEKVLREQKMVSLPKGVKQDFPNHRLMQELEVESLIGIPLISSSGSFQGLMGVMSSKPLEDREMAEEILPVFAIRAAVELERKRSEEALRENEALLRVIFDQAIHLMGLLKPDGTLIKINRTASDFIEARDSEVIGKPFWETPWWTHSPEQQERLRKAIKAAAQGEFISFQANHKTMDGKLIYVNFSLKPVKDEKGRVVLIVPEGIDIGEQNYPKDH